MIKVGIVGGAGYTAGELIRLLVNHSKVEIDFVYSTSNAGNYIYQVHQDLLGSLNLKFTDEINTDIDVLFLCLAHGNSIKFLKGYEFSKNTRIIDLSNDFRLNAANPGCFATAIQLALLPLAKQNLLNDTVHVNATTGATGAGVSPHATTHFSWRDNNFSVYKPFKHQHLGEIVESLQQMQGHFTEEIIFIPNRGNFSRGIFASIYLNFDQNIDEANELFERFYEGSPFTHISNAPIHLKQVVNTNNCFLHLQVHKRHL